MEELGEMALIEALRSGDESAFRHLFRTLNATLLRVARNYAQTDAVAEEIVQETWIGVVTGIDRFEARSSLRTWIFRIMVNIAQDPRQPRGAQHPLRQRRAAGAEQRAARPRPLLPQRPLALRPVTGASGPAPWGVPEERLMAGETRETILAAIDELPPNQREVIVLRDIGGWPRGDVCNALGITETNGRVLLHRARAKVRAAVEGLLGAVEPTT